MEFLFLKLKMIQLGYHPNQLLIGDHNLKTLNLNQELLLEMKKVMLLKKQMIMKLDII